MLIKVRLLLLTKCLTLEDHSSLRRGTNNMRVRDWLNGKDYDFQYQYGLKILKKYGY